MRAFGYLHTESSHLASEYLPYFGKNAALINSFIPVRWPAVSRVRDVEARTRELLAAFKEELVPSTEFGAYIIHSMVTGQPRVIYGNVPNRGLIANLPEGCCVEVPCLVDGNGLQPTAVGALPPLCAAINRTNINVQELAVEAARTGDREHIYHAIMLDPLTSAVLTLEQMLAAETAWLPAFAQ